MKKAKHTRKTPEKTPRRLYWLWLPLVLLLLIPGGISPPAPPQTAQREPVVFSGSPTHQISLEEGRLCVALDLLRAAFPFFPGDALPSFPPPPLGDLRLRLTLELKIPENPFP